MKSSRFRLKDGLIIILAVANIGTAHALTWTGVSPGTDTTPTGGNWNDASVWRTTGSGEGDTTWTGTSNSAVFGGADGTYSVKLGSAITATGLTFNNSGYELNSTDATVRALTLTGAVNVAAGESAAIGDKVTVQRTAATAVLLGTAGVASGTLEIKTGGTLQATNTGTYQIVGAGTVIDVSGTLARTNTADASANLLRLANHASDNVTVNVKDGGVVSVGGRRLEIGFLGNAAVTVETGGRLEMTSATGGHVYAGFGTSSGSLTVSGGTVSTGAVGELIVAGGTSTGVLNVSSGNVTANGRMALAENGTGSATLSGTGAISIKSTTTGLNFASGSSAAATGVFHLNGGTLTTPAVSKNTAGASATFNFNGGALKANKANATFMTGLDSANVDAGGAKIDPDGFDITIAQALIHKSSLGATTDGGLVKQGGGTLTLTGVNTYTGETTVAAGALALLGLGSINESSGLELGTEGVGAGTIDVSSITASSFSIGNLTGNGQVAATGKEITINGALAPGFSVGSLVLVANSTILAASSTTQMELTGAGTEGVGYDFVDASGILTYGGDLSVAFSFAQAGVFNLFDFAGYGGDFENVTITGLASASLLQTGELWQGSDSGYQFTFDQATGNLTVVPEPSGLLLGALGCLVLLRRRMR